MSRSTFCKSHSGGARIALLGVLSAVAPLASGQVSLTTAQVAKRVSPSVVVIHGKTDSGDVLGSGFIVSKDGKVVTNLHVIRDMKTASVQLAGGEVFDSVSVRAVDERRDLAVVQIAGFDLHALELGNSDALVVGEPLVIVGSPRGLEGTVTAGILSSVRDSGEGFKVLQTDAAVNPGNSGGPLVNSKGQVVGVVSFKLLAAEGLNFAIPANYVRGLLSDLHEPTTLDQMRGSLSANSATHDQNGGPSLKETLGWLKEKIPMGVLHRVLLAAPGRGMMDSHSVQSTAWSFDSCTVEFGVVWNVVTTLVPSGSAKSSTTYDYTVPLGSITGAKVERHGNEEEFVSGDKFAYFLSLSTRSKEIRAVKSVEGYAPVPAGASYSDEALLLFNDESIAQRVKSAFLHAASLCRAKEPF